MTEPATAATANGCCGKPQGCGITDALCPYMNHKRRCWRAVLPKCSECGGGEGATRHVASFHPEHHPFMEAQSA